MSDDNIPPLDIDAAVAASLAGTNPLRTVDADHHEYRVGRRDANKALDSGPFDVPDLLALGDQMADVAHRDENVALYHYVRGVTDTLREWQADRSDI